MKTKRLLGFAAMLVGFCFFILLAVLIYRGAIYPLEEETSVTKSGGATLTVTTCCYLPYGVDTTDARYIGAYHGTKYALIVNERAIVVTLVLTILAIMVVTPLTLHNALVEQEGWRLFAAVVIAALLADLFVDTNRPVGVGPLYLSWVGWTVAVVEILATAVGSYYLLVKPLEVALKRRFSK